MEGDGDEFGDIYADVEVKTAAVNDESAEAAQLEINGCNLMEDDDDDSEEDDLDILLNDDDDDDDGMAEKIPINRNQGERKELGETKEEEKGERDNGGCFVSHYKYMRPHLSAFPSASKGNRCEGPGSFSSPLIRGDQEDNWGNQRMRSSLVETKNLHHFSLPRSRTILDVNIDAFDEKPWRHPGANITDYFNFDFDEDSWKHYCNHLDQYRHGDVGPTKNLTYDSSGRNLNETVSLTVGAVKSQKSRERTVPRAHQNHSEMKGRAIQVADSIGERKSSMDTRHPRDRDSDVVIQINVQDSEEDLTCSFKEKVGRIDSSESGADGSGNISLDNDVDGLSFGSASDELPGESLNGHNEGLDIPALKRCSIQKLPHEEVAFCDLEEAAKTVEISKDTMKEVGRSTCNTTPAVLGEESLHDEWSQCSPSSSHSESDSETLHGGYFDENLYNYVRRPSLNYLTDLQKSLPSNCCYSKNVRSHSVKLKHGYRKYSARRRSPIQEKSEHNRQSLSSMSAPRKPLNPEEPIPISELKKLYNVYRSAQNHSRYDKIPEAIMYDDGNDFLYSKEVEFSSNYYNEKFPDYKIEESCTRYSHRKSQQRFKVSRNSDEGDYLLDDEMMTRDWDQYESRFSVDSMHPFTFEESRHFNLNYLEDERDARWKGIGGELQFHKETRKKNGFAFGRKHTYGPLQRKYRRTGLQNYRERNNLIRKDEEHFPYNRKKTVSPGRNRFVDDEDDWTTRNYQSMSSHSYRETRTANRIKWHGTMSPRYTNEICERYGRGGGFNREIWAERYRKNGMNVSYTEALGENFNIPDDRVYSGRKEHDREPQLLHYIEDKKKFRHRKYKIHAETLSCKRTSWHNRFDAKHRTDHLRNRIDDMHEDQINYKVVSEGDIDNQCERNSNMSRSGNHKRMLLKCGDSVDSRLFNGKGKSRGRFSATGNVVYNNSRNSSMDLDFVNVDQSTFMESTGTRSNMENDAVLEISQNDENGPYSHQNEALDIEEGQLLTDEINECAMENNICLSGNAVQTHVKGLHSKNATNESMTDEGCRNPRILEVMAKMEKRRERFKEPIILKDKNSKPLDILADEIGGTKQQRASRKRRWGGK